ncbi:MAG: S-layer homology domain-containing protein [Oscillospiraceae bacterium]|nr:S-layer homology domain-containing protein [Oscillospiraceae bacterium]
MSKISKVLSLMLAVVMVLGMAIIPTSAATGFKDADQITYSEEVAITAGLGLFAGADGKFMPQDTVTRAQMATIIIKMLHGADANADGFKGVKGGFTDTAGFEGGWAEGYINWCSSLGIVKGYGDGTFKPGNKVTAAEAVTMILNALKIDAGEGTWPVTVMAKAEEVKFFEDLNTKPASDKALSREELAVVSLAGLEYSPEGKTGYMYEGKVFDSYFDALLVAGDASKITPAANDTLATKVYELKTMEGFITANQDTGMDYTVLNGVTPFAIESDLDSIGHYVTVYYKELYKSEEEPGVTYAISDETVVVEVNEAIETAKEYKNAFGKTYNRNTGITMIDGEYNVLPGTGSIADYEGGSKAPVGTYFIHKGNIVAYMEPVERYASYVSAINTYEGEEGVLINGATDDNSYIPNTEGDDRLMEYASIKEGDFVTYVKAQGIYFVEKANLVKGSITRTSKVEVNGQLRDVVTLSGTEFVAFGGQNNVGSKLSNNLGTLNYGEKYDLYITDDDEYIGFASTGSLDMSDIVYVVGSGAVPSKDKYGKQIISTVARCVDMEGKEQRVVVGITKDGETLGTDVLPASGFYYAEDSTDKDARQEGIQMLTRLPKNYDGQGGVFAVTSSGSDQSFYSSGYRHLKTSDGMQTYGKSGSKYMVVDGDMTSLELDVDILSTLTGFAAVSESKFDLLVSRSADGANNVIEVMVITGMSSAEVTAGTGAPIYVTAEQIANGSRTADGYVYEVYNAADGALIEILVEDDAAIAPGQDGFYSMSKEDELAILTKLDHNAAVTDAYVRQNQGLLGLYSGRELKSMNTGLTLPYNSSASVKVMDVRSEEQVQADKAARINSTAQLVDLLQNEEGVAVVADLFVNKQSGSDPKVGCIYITSITRNTPGFQSILYAFDTPGTTGENVPMALVRNNRGTATGQTVSVTWENALNANGKGFYLYSVDPDGKHTLVPLSTSESSVGYPGTLGMHNTVEQVDVDAMTLVTADGSAQCGCSIVCVHANEAWTGALRIAEETVIYDMGGKQITLAELAQLAEDYDDLFVDYYCADAVISGENAEDDTPEAVFVYSTEAAAPLHPHDCGHTHVLEGKWQSLNERISGMTAILEINDGGLFYLEEDLTLPTAHINFNADTVICLNGHNFNGSTSGQYIFRANGCTVEICDCSETPGTIGNWTQGVNGSTGSMAIIRTAGGRTATLNMYNVNVAGNSSQQTFYVVANNKLNLSGVTIKNNVSSASSPKIINNLGTVTFEDVVFENNTGEPIAGSGTHTGTYTDKDAQPVLPPTPPVTEAHTHTCSHSHAVTSGEWIAFSTVMTDGSNTELAGGRYYLDKDIVLNSGTNTAGYINFSGDSVFCLNGHTITAGTKQANVFRTNNTVTVDICDCVGTGKVTGHQATGTTNSVFIARNGGTFNIHGGTYTGNSGKSLMYIADGNVKVNILGGTFSANSTETDVYFAKDGATAGTAQVSLYGGTPTTASTAALAWYRLVASGSQYELQKQ